MHGFYLIHLSHERLSKGCYEVYERLSKCCGKVPERLSKDCRKTVLQRFMKTFRNPKWNHPKKPTRNLKSNRFQNQNTTLHQRYFVSCVATRNGLGHVKPEICIFKHLLGKRSKIKLLGKVNKRVVWLFTGILTKESGTKGNKTCPCIG